MRWQRHLRLYVALVFLLGTVSLTLSYGVWSSDAWFWAFGAQPSWLEPDKWQNTGGLLEGLRLLALCTLFYLGVRYQLRESGRWAWGRGVVPVRLVRWSGWSSSWFGLILWLAAGLFLPVFHAWVAPGDLADAFSSKVLTQVSLEPVSDFERYHLPYLLYLPYSVCTYLLLAVPLLLVVRQSIQHDRRKLARLLRGIGRRRGRGLMEFAVHLRRRVAFVYRNLRRVMNRYAWVLFLLALYYLGELVTRAFDTLSCAAQFATSWSAWIFLLFIVPYFFVRTYRRFAQGSRAVRLSLRDLGREAEASSDAEALDQIEKVESRLESETLVGYLRLLSRTSVAYLLTAFITLGLGGWLLTQALEGRDVRPMVNRALPVPIDAAVIWALEVVPRGFSTSAATPYQYKYCFESQAPLELMEERYGSGDARGR